MKTIPLCFCVYVLCCFNSLYAQDETDNGLLFPQFEKGDVIFKNGTRSSALLNYNTLQEEMLFKDGNGTIMALDDILKIFAVTIGERRFVPVSSKGIFYEEIQAGKGSFFIHQKATMLSQGKPAGYGGYSQSSSTTSYGSYQDNASGTVVKLNPDEKFKIKTHYVFYLKSGKSYKKFSSAKTLGKLFKGHESEIEEFAKTQSIDFSKTNDVSKIVEFGFSLISD